jgi:hypothetical protein
MNKAWVVEMHRSHNGRFVWVPENIHWGRYTKQAASDEADNGNEFGDDRTKYRIRRWVREESK